MQQARTLRQLVSTRIPTRWGHFRVLGFELSNPVGGRPAETALVLMMGDPTAGVPLLRIHSQCLTGEILGSLRCDCHDQLEIAMQAIADLGRGLVIYEHQEGRGIGLMAKLAAYDLQDGGLDTVEANHALGFEADCRSFSLPIAILHELGIERVRLLTNNPAKSRALTDAGIEVAMQVPCEARPTPHSATYLLTKKYRLGHALSLGKLTSEAIPQRPVAKDLGERSGRPTAQDEHEFEFASVDEAVREIEAGRMIVVVDDEDRENEGDLTMAAEKITPEAVSFMATHGKGLICLAMSGTELDRLGLDAMLPENTALGGTAFTVSIDGRGPGVTTGISSHDRAHTIRSAADSSSRPEDFARPGHVFPLRARPGGVLERRGQTEAAVDLANLAGLRPAGVICEIVNGDGTMARVPDLIGFCKAHGLKMVTVAELARYRCEHDRETFEQLLATC